MSNKKLTDSLSKILAETYTLYLKTQNYHWNVTGPFFGQLHEMFGGQYEALVEPIDAIAERIRALGATAPGTMREFSKLSGIKEASYGIKAGDMLKHLRDDNRKLVETLKEGIEICGEADDKATEDMLIERVEAHEKAIWMLEATLKGS